MHASFVAIVGLIAFVGIHASATEATAQTKGDKSAPTATGPALAGGASALSETHGDWTVNCRIVGDAKICGFSHQQFNNTNNQRVLAIELSTRDAESASGTLALPLGLALAKGVNLQVDDTKIEGSLPFSTCLVVGCLVPVSFDAMLVGQLKAGATLKVDGTVSDTGQPITFGISLRGFGSALARTADLSAN